MRRRTNLSGCSIIAVFLLGMAGTSALAVKIDWVSVGDPCNTADTEVMNDGTTGYGSKSYVYRIGKYEVTNSQYCEFLNAVARTDTYGLYNPNMAGGLWDSGGIARSGSPGYYTYSVRLGRGNNPVNYVSWYDALRFANWLHNGQPTGGQNISTTEDGAYTFSGAESVSERNTVSQVFVPSEDEWYKAAYYKGGGADSGYWDYATQSDAPPTLEPPPGGNNSANAGSAPAGGHGLTDVGAYVNSVGAYGTFDQNGNLIEWNETRFGLNQWCLRGGAWDMNPITMAAYHRDRNNPAYLESWNFGFRVASVPKPPAIYYVDLDADGANDGSSWDDAFNYLQDALDIATNGDEIRVSQGIYKPSEFTLPLPGQAINPNPADDATDVNLPITLSWTAGDGADSYDIYFGTISQPPFVSQQSYTFFYLGTLEDYTTYYWRIDSINVWGKTTGQVWTFTTGKMLPPPPPPPPGWPGKAKDPYPADGATSVGINTDLSWTAGYRAMSHDVYFGTSSLPPFIGNQTATTFNPGTMDENTSYYWRIDELNSSGTNIGDIWSFTTTGGGPPPPPPPPAPGFGESREQATAMPISREDTYQLINGVVIKGGYAGFGEPDPNARDIDKYKTILSGDLLGDDVGDFTNFSKWENSYHVVTGSGCDETAVLDGFTITAGNDNRTGQYNPIGGGGMLNESGSPTVSNCTFIDNYVSDSGGGMFNLESDPIVTNCTFIVSHAGRKGGGIFNFESDPVMTNCTFISNSAGYGGAICNYRRCWPILSKCIFRGNLAGDGGAIYNFQQCAPTLTNCIFTGNSAVRENGVGGGMCNYDLCHSTLTNCTFAGNKAKTFGGTMYNMSSLPTLTNCILWDGEDGIYNTFHSDTVITYSDVQGGWPGTGNIDIDPCFVEPEYFDPVAYWKFDETAGTTAYDSAGLNHGNVYGAQWTSGQVGSALAFDGMNDYVDMSDTVKNYLGTNYTVSAWIQTNTITNPHGIVNYRRSTLDIGYQILFELDHNYNEVRFIVGGLGNNAVASFPDALTTNTWYHLAGVREGNLLNVYVDGVNGIPDSETFGTISPDNLTIGALDCCGHGQHSFFNGTIDEVKIFDRALSVEEIQQDYLNGLNGQGYPSIILPDYHLLPNSPCINAGDPNYIAAPNETDLEGLPRVIGGRIDMGSYEFQNTPPVADAGPDQIVECACDTEEGTKVILDGTGSYDADGDPLAYTWTGTFIESPVHGAAPIVTLEGGCPGEYVIALVANDGTEDSEPNYVVTTVVDTTPPEFELSVAPVMLWPPDHKMVEITLSWTISDECDASPDVSLVSIVANEGDDIIGDGHTSDDIQIDDDGSIFLRSERSGTGSDRVYTITYQAVDDSGNTTVRSAMVSIPHDFKVLSRIAARWLWTNRVGRIPEDLNSDGIVNLAGFARFANNWIK